MQAELPSAPTAADADAPPAGAADAPPAAAAAAMTTPAEPDLVNCLMLVTWPQRANMIQEAIASFAAQTHAAKELTVVNDGAPCRFGAAFAAAGLRGRIVHAPPGTTIGEKRNAGAAASSAAYVASFDDDDVSLPGRLAAQVAALDAAGAVWLSASRKFIAIGAVGNIVGFEHGRCYGAGMITAAVTRAHAWPPLSYREDHKLYEAVRADDAFGAARCIESDELLYVHRRHDANASAAHRADLWQGVLPLPLGGADALARAAEVGRLLAAAPADAVWLEAGEDVQSLIDLPLDVLALILCRLPRAHDIARAAPGCRALRDAVRRAFLVRPYSNEVVALEQTRRRELVTCVATARDDHIVTGFNHPFVDVWRNGEKVRSIETQQSEVSAVAVLPDGARFITK